MRDAWLLPGALALHVAEEAPGFGAWARRHAWAGYSERDFAVINAVGLAMTIGTTAAIGRRPRPLAYWAFYSAVVAQQTVWNPVFHIVTTLRWRERSPGLLTGPTDARAPCLRLRLTPDLRFHSARRRLSRGNARYCSGWESETLLTGWQSCRSSSKQASGAPGRRRSLAARRRKSGLAAHEGDACAYGGAAAGDRRDGQLGPPSPARRARDRPRRDVSEQGGEAGPAYACAPVRASAAALAASPFMPSSR
jgi:hypothetical protein